MATATARVTLPPGQLRRMTAGRSSPVGRMMAGFAGIVTQESKGVARERTTSRTGRHINSIRSTTEGSAAGVKVVTRSITYAGAPEKATRAHVIRPRRAQVLRFQVGGKVVFAREVHHPGTKARNILRDGVRRAGRRLG